MSHGVLETTQFSREAKTVVPFGLKLLEVGDLAVSQANSCQPSGLWPGGVLRLAVGLSLKQAPWVDSSSHIYHGLSAHL